MALRAGSPLRIPFRKRKGILRFEITGPGIQQLWICLKVDFLRMKVLRITTALLCVAALFAPSREIRDIAAALATSLWVWMLVSHPAKYSRLVPFGVLAGVLAMSFGIVVIFRGNAPKNDFLQFYVGAQNAGARNFYAMAASSATTQSLLQNQFPMPFVRLPFYAFLLRPLAGLEYRTAYAVWQALSAASFVAVALLWSGRRPCVALA